MEPKPEDRRVPMIVTMTLKDLRDLPSAGNVIGPKLTLARYELGSDDPARPSTCRPRVFRDVMPRKQDLQYLAHVREVETRQQGDLVAAQGGEVLCCHLQSLS